MARKRDSGSVTTMVCVTCGAEQFFDGEAPSALRCEKCQSTVFREFSTPTKKDDVVISRLEEQARSIAYGDPSPDTTADDVRDLELL